MPAHNNSFPRNLVFGDARGKGPESHVRTFSVDDAPTVHRLLVLGYSQGGGHVGTFEE
jgi:hypothetical protein